MTRNGSKKTAIKFGELGEEYFIKGKEVIRTKMGVPGLDALVEGGLPVGTSTIVMGPPGSGKTILAAQFIAYGAKSLGENGIILLLRQSREKYLLDIKRFDFNLEELETTNKITIREIQPLATSFNDLLMNLVEMVKKNNIKRIVIDPFSLFFNLLTTNEKRREVTLMLETIGSLGCTLILVVERNTHEPTLEEFAADSLIDLSFNFRKNRVLRDIKIPKMRRTSITTPQAKYVIAKEGIRIITPYVSTVSKIATLDRVKTGISSFDDMSYGGFRRSSVTLISGNAGCGKTVFCLQYGINQANVNEKVLYIGFEQSPEQLTAIAKSFGWDTESLIAKGFMDFICEYPENLSIEEHFERIHNRVNELQPKHLIIDSLTALSHTFDIEETRFFTQKLVELAENKGVTTIFTDLTQGITGTTVGESHASTLADNIILLKYFELDGLMRRSMTILKMRGADFDKDIREYKIAKEGLVVLSRLSGVGSIMTGSAVKFGKEVEEKLREEFASQLGPLGIKKYVEVSKEGIGINKIENFIDDLKTKGILSQEKSDSFKYRVRIIVKGEALPEESTTEKKTQQHGTSFLRRFMEK